MDEQQPGQPQPNPTPPAAPVEGQPAANTEEAGSSEYKPNIYQLIFWALTYGVIAGLGLFVLQLVSNYLSLLWGPVFLAALIWGGYRNYLKQKQEWHSARGQQIPQLNALDQIKEAARDVVTASQEVARQQQEEDAILAQRAAEEEAVAAQVPVTGDESVETEEPQSPPPAPPQTPQPPAPPAPPTA